MSWEMTMARALISSQPQIPLGPSQGSGDWGATGVPNGRRILFSEKKKAISTVMPLM